MKVWEYSLAQHCAPRTLTGDSGPDSSRVPSKPFAGDVPRREFRDGLEYQLAISARSRNPHLKALHADNPDVPVSGEKRSGILVFDGDRIVASLFTEGNDFTTIKYMLFVADDYRGQGLAVDIWVTWEMAFPEWNHPSRHTETVAARKIMIKAHRKLVQLAVEAGHHVPAHVLESVRPGSFDEREAMRLPNGRMAA